MSGIPEGAQYAVPVFAMFLGDIMKKLKLTDWIITANAVLGAVIVASMVDSWGWETLAQGLTLGLAGTGLHGARKMVSNKAKK